MTNPLSNLPALLETAEAATPGPWRWHDTNTDEPVFCNVSEKRVDLRTTWEEERPFVGLLPKFVVMADEMERDEDAAFIATFSPDVAAALVRRVIGLIDENDKLNRALFHAKTGNPCPDDTPIENGWWGLIDERDAALDRVRVLRDELDSIRVYAGDTSSGRADGRVTDKKWWADGIREIYRRASQALADDDSGGG